VLSIVVINTYALDLWASCCHGCGLLGVQIFVFTVCCFSEKVSYPQHMQDLSNRHNSQLYSRVIKKYSSHFTPKQTKLLRLTTTWKWRCCSAPTFCLAAQSLHAFLALTLVLVRPFCKQSDSLTWQNTSSFLLHYFFSRLLNRIIWCLPLVLTSGASQNDA